jgi:hypothetical protein
MRNYEAEKVAETQPDAGFLATIIGDGVLLLLATAASLVLAGGFAMLLAASGEFLPHDIAYLGVSAADLCLIARCRIVDFMIHDRAAFGGALFGVGVLYTYLVLFPLRQGQAWAWWLLAISGSAGFLSFLAYLGYGYLDTWHGLGTALLLPVFVVGLLRSRRLVGQLARPLVLLPARESRSGSARRRAGRACLLLGAVGTALGGLTILRVGTRPRNGDRRRHSPSRAACPLGSRSLISGCFVQSTKATCVTLAAIQVPSATAHRPQRRGTNRAYQHEGG